VNPPEFEEITSALHTLVEPDPGYGRTPHPVTSLREGPDDVSRRPHDVSRRKARRRLRAPRENPLMEREDDTGGLREGDVLIRRYRLEERIAKGGMSVIWRAFDQALERSVAVKVHDGPFDGDHGCRELIRREARTAARLHHPDVIEVYDYGETVTPQGRVAAFVVMRLLQGRPLAERLAEGPLLWWEALRIAERIALVLAAAHEQGIVHRDVTPENVLLTSDGAKLLDFGIAAIEDDHGSERFADFGTPPYVAPERLHGVTADPAVDVYSLGVLLFEMLTGHLPYPEHTWEAIEVVRRIGPPPTPAVPGLPQEAAELCRSCLSQNPRHRPSAQEAAEVLARAASKRRRKHSWPAWVAMAGLSR
jgi:serine/threonine protein kinase